MPVVRRCLLLFLSLASGVFANIKRRRLSNERFKISSFIIDGKKSWNFSDI
jgi:hypothetical protein